jgi:hypothetical protein
MKDTYFPNGFSSWQETHYEVVSTMTFYLHNHPEIVIDGGTGWLYELAEKWTDKFEELNKNREWNGEFFEEIDDFMSERLQILEDDSTGYFRR